MMADKERKIRAESKTMVVLVKKGILQVHLGGRDFLFFFLGLNFESKEGFLYSIYRYGSD